MQLDRLVKQSVQIIHARRSFKIARTSSQKGALMSTFQVGGEIKVNRLGFGAMQITGPAAWGPPRDPAEALQVLKRLPALGIDFIDTADSYGPGVSERLIREALH